MDSPNKNSLTVVETVGHTGPSQFQTIGGRQLAEYAFYSGLVFSLRAGKPPLRRMFWRPDSLTPGAASRSGKGSPGNEAAARPVRPASGRGADRRVRAR